MGSRPNLHVPSPTLLKAFLERGARRFVFEGRECGGHVGPRSSFVLWETMIQILLDGLDGEVQPEDLNLLFAGGIHDARSAAMVAAMAAPLSERGSKLGVLMGTGYLFTEEAVASGAIVEGFQEVAVDCRKTVLVETGPGHAIRCAETLFAETFTETKRRLHKEETPAEKVQETLEEMNLGRLRIASKGIVRSRDHAESPDYVEVSSDQQRADGMYMIGQLAALRKKICRIEDLHRDVSIKSSTLLESLSVPFKGEKKPVRRKEEPLEVAIIGMGCLLPKAEDRTTFWANVLSKVDGITEIPKSRFDWRLYFDADPKGRDRIYSKWGGFLDDILFDPMRYGIPPNALSSIDPFQLLTLEVVRQALGDAGYLDRKFPKDRASVILGTSGGLGDVGMQYGFRSQLPMFLGEVPDGVLEQLPEWTEDSFAGILLNVAAGRVSNRFDLGGVNFTVDAACASSLAAVYLAARELRNGTSDIVLAGGVDTVQSPFGFLCFSKTQALSPHGRCRTFDAGADGIAISEGLVVLVLKRLAEAERDGDRIYATLQSVAGSSDGRDLSLTAPRFEGQVRALERAYAQAKISPATVGLIEAHGTGTVAGDTAEVAALSQVFSTAGSQPKSCALGSVKSMIGHTKGAAGVAGLMKAALALYHRILPPTLHVQKPNARLETGDSPFFVTTDPLPWITRDSDTPRRAGISSFGFGGTNFHAVLEEYGGDFGDPGRNLPVQEWPGELFFWNAASPDGLKSSLATLEDWLERGFSPTMRSLAATVCNPVAAPHSSPSAARLAIVASTLEDLRSKLKIAKDALDSQRSPALSDGRGVYLSTHTSPSTQSVALLFPGQGSQYPYMLRDLALHFPEIVQTFELANQALAGALPRELSSYVYPPPAFDPSGQEDQMRAVTDTVVAQPALGAVEMGLFRLLKRLGLAADMTAGHSYGEYVALAAAGVLSEETLFRISETRGRLIKEAVRENPGAMSAVMSDEDTVAEALKEVQGVWLANFNSPQQTIIAGKQEDLVVAVEALESKDFNTRAVPVSCAFHTPLMEDARDKLANVLSTVEFLPPTLQVFSNSLAGEHGSEPERIREVLAEHLVRPVQFVREIQAMYDQGARVFLEVGPKSVLTSLVKGILEGREAVAIATDVPERNGVVQLLHALSQLVVQGVPVNLATLFDGRAAPAPSLKDLEGGSGEDLRLKWLVSGSRVRPASSSSESIPEPTLPVKDEDRTGTPAQESQTPVAEAARETQHQEPKAISAEGRSPANEKAKPVWRAKEPSQQSQLPAADDPPEAVMLQFQKLMGQFLQTQREIMTAYLQNGNVEAADAAVSAALQTIPSPPVYGTGKVQEAASMLPHNEREMAATEPDPQLLSSDGSSPATEESTGNLVEETIPPAVAHDFAGQLLGLVSERTGYPTEMLDVDLNIEADLGIDSIKRVEILSSFERQCTASQRPQIQTIMDQLTRLKTLRRSPIFSPARSSPIPHNHPGTRCPLRSTSSSRGIPARRPQQMVLRLPVSRRRRNPLPPPAILLGICWSWSANVPAILPRCWTWI